MRFRWMWVIAVIVGLSIVGCGKKTEEGAVIEGQPPLPPQPAPTMGNPPGPAAGAQPSPPGPTPQPIPPEMGSPPGPTPGGPSGASPAASGSPADQQMQVKVKNALLAGKNLSAKGITVKVENGSVTLTGKVRTAQEKQLAEKIAKQQSGVKSVKNDLTVGE